MRLLLIMLVLVLTGCGTLSPESYSVREHAHHQHQDSAVHKIDDASLKIEVLNATPLTQGKPARITFQLVQLDENKPLSLDDLKTVHTKKLHLLAIDPTLTNYHHIHPLPDTVPGQYHFTFTPQETGYWLWLDVTPLATGKQEYVPFTFGKQDKTAAIDKTPHTIAQVGQYTFRLNLAETLHAGKPTLARLEVTKNDKPFTQLQPVLGAFAHLVGFNEDRQSVMHIHPLGQEPKTDTERGGSTLMFHIEPEKTGFVKLFAQFRIDNKDVFVPFGVTVTK
jgi:hypothetical protein